MIHRFWMGEPYAGVDHLPALQRLHDDAITDWTPASLPDDLRPLTELVDHPGRTSDLVRLALLDRFGGLWVDHDVEALANLTSSSTPWTASVGGLRLASTMWFPEPGHRMVQESLARLLDCTRQPPLSRILNAAGHRFDDVAHEPRACPFDAAGVEWSDPTVAIAIHHWDTSGRS